MSRVFVATETALRREVVVKVLPPELVAGVNVERFRREILLAAGLQHPHIVTVLAAGEMEGLPWFTMPFVQGESLRQRLLRGPLSITESIDLLRDVAKALVYAHSRGIVHRDIKPDNVLLSGGSAVVTDFGIAKALSAARAEQANTETRGELTQIGTSIGTPTYMAPEQAAADPATDARADLYSFGCMAYEVLTGRPPFADMTPQKLLAAHMAETPRPLREVRPDVPPLLAALVMRCLEKDPERRPQSAQDVVRALEIAVSGSGDTQDAALAVLLRRHVRLSVALALWAATFAAVYLIARAAIVGIGLPGWVLPGALIVAALGLPAILFTSFVHRAARRALTATPTRTPGGAEAPRGPIATIAMKASPHVSWARTVRAGAVAFGVFALLVAAFMTLRALGIGPAASLFAAGTLNERDRIVVADFAVPGEDSSLGPVISEGVRTALGESSVLSVVSPTSVAGALARMERSPTSRLDVGLAREVALREGAKAVVSGDVTPLRGGFVITMRLVTADSGYALASFQETADGPRDLLPALDKLVRKLRAKTGESLRSVQRNPPLAEVTTSSLEALRKYVAGERAYSVEANFDKSIALFREAIRLDSTFAMAYRSLVAVMLVAGYGDDVTLPLLTRAYQDRARLTERERLYVEGSHFARGQGRDRARGGALLEQLMARDPNHVPGAIALGSVYITRGDAALAETLLLGVRKVEPDNRILSSNIGRVRLQLGRVDEQLDSLTAWEGRNTDAPRFRYWTAPQIWVAGQYDNAERSLRVALGEHDAVPARRVRSLFTLAAMVGARGKLAESERLLAEARASDAARGGNLYPLDDSLWLAHADAWHRGKPERALARVEKALALYPLSDQPENETRPDMFAAIVLARAGRPDQARAIVAQWDAGVRDTSLKRWMEPFRAEALGEIALAENKPLVAIEEFRRSARRADGMVEGCFRCREAQIAMAYDRAENADLAIAAFGRYLGHSDLSRMPGGISESRGGDDRLYLAGSYKRLGELYEAKGDVPHAIANLEKFVELWKGADPELQPMVADARARIARLARAEKR